MKLLLAAFYTRTERIEDAEKIVKDLITAYPDEEKYRLALVRFYGEQKQEDAMIETLNETIKDLPEQYGAYQMLAGYYVNKKDLDKAIEVLDRFMEKVRTGPDYLKAKIFKAGIRIEEKRYDDALDSCRRSPERKSRRY